MDIRIDDLGGLEIARLLQEHLHEMFLHSPPESVHALDLARLRRPEITFWTVGKAARWWVAAHLRRWRRRMARSSPCAPLPGTSARASLRR